MTTRSAATELAHARLDIPRTSVGKKRTPTNAVSAIDVSIRQYLNGELVVRLRTEPGMDACTLPLLACLQFISRFEEAAGEALTKRR
jgi:hypothetical protein